MTAAPILSLKPGTFVDFVRWHLTRNGWEAETRRVRYVRSDKETITGIAGDELVQVARGEWELALP